MTVEDERDNAPIFRNRTTGIVEPFYTCRTLTHSNHYLTMFYFVFRLLEKIVMA